MAEITKNMVADGYKQSLIRLVTEDGNNENTVGVACGIGEYWFYLGLEEADTSTLKEFTTNNTEEQIIDYIYNVLEDMRNNPDMYDTEYKYYYWCLKEFLCMKEFLE